MMEEVEGHDVNLTAANGPIRVRGKRFTRNVCIRCKTKNNPPVPKNFSN